MASMSIPANGASHGRPPARDQLYAALDDLAARDDREDCAPVESMAYLVAIGATRAVLPSDQGGMELGWSATASCALDAWLRGVGGTHLALARLFEGHVNAFQLLWTYGTVAQREAACAYVDGGGWLGVWAAPNASGPLQLRDHQGKWVLTGSKAYASGAGLIDRPLVTARHDTLGVRMVWPHGGYEAGPPSEWAMSGMRASVTVSVHFADADIHPDMLIGEADDYHREPTFSVGVWRYLAAQWGAGERLGQLLVEHLTAAQRAEDSHQRARLADVAMALATADLWVNRAREAADDEAAPWPVRLQTVRMARLMVERELLRVIARVQRAIGLQAFNRAAPVERIARDLQTYLRQPVPDQVRDAIGAAYVSAHAPAAKADPKD